MKFKDIYHYPILSWCHLSPAKANKFKSPPFVERVVCPRDSDLSITLHLLIIFCSSSIMHFNDDQGEGTSLSCYPRTAINSVATACSFVCLVNQSAEGSSLNSSL